MRNAIILLQEVFIMTEWCSAYDPEKSYCTHLEMKFYEGMQKPCDFTKEPKDCPTVQRMEASQG